MPTVRTPRLLLQPQRQPEVIAQLECEKLRREIASMDLSWWKRPAYLGVAVPLAIAILGFLAALLSGYFSDIRDTLQREVDALTDQRDTLQNTVDLTHRTGLRAISDAWKIIEGLEVANREAHFMIGRLESQGVEDTAIEKIQLLYDANERAANDAMERMMDARERLDELPVSRR